MSRTLQPEAPRSRPTSWSSRHSRLQARRGQSQRTRLLHAAVVAARDLSPPAPPEKIANTTKLTVSGLTARELHRFSSSESAHGALASSRASSRYGMKTWLEGIHHSHMTSMHKWPKKSKYHEPSSPEAPRSRPTSWSRRHSRVGGLGFSMQQSLRQTIFLLPLLLRRSQTPPS